MNDMDGIGVSSSTEEGDYIDELSRILPSYGTFTFYERILIVAVVGTFLSIVGCALFCLIYSQSPLRRRYSARKKLDREQQILVATAPRKDTYEYASAPPHYDSIVKADDIVMLNGLRKTRFSNWERNSSYGTTSDSDGVQSNSGDHPSLLNGRLPRSQSARLSLSNGGRSSTQILNYPLPPFAQVNAELNIDIKKKLLIVHLTNGEHVSVHPAFDEQAEYFIHIQLLNNKLLKKLHDARRKRRSSLQLSVLKNLQEKTTKKLSRISNDTLVCDEYLQFEFNNDDDITSTSLRFLLFCIDRSGIQDLLFESIIRLNSSMTSNHQEVIHFKDLPQITFGEILLGISYLPTAERFTIKINKLRYFCKIEKDQKIDARLMVTFFHHGRRFFQKKLPSITFDESIMTNNNMYEIKDTIIQNVPQNDIQSVYIHFELVIHIFNSTTESIISCGSILLGEQTRYKTDWEKMLEQPRQTHLGWYQFFG